MSPDLKFRCPRFAILQSLQTKPRFDFHPNWFTDILSKNILLNIWNGTGTLFRACTTALIVSWKGHANCHLCLGHYSPVNTPFCLPSLFSLRHNCLWEVASDPSDLDMLPSISCWCPKIDGNFEDPQRFCICLLQSESSHKLAWSLGLNRSWFSKTLAREVGIRVFQQCYPLYCEWGNV